MVNELIITRHQVEIAMQYSAHILTTNDSLLKAEQSIKLGKAWIESISIEVPFRAYPERPGTSDQPVLLAPGRMKKRSLYTLHGRQSLLHALAHIELNAINLAWDMVGRFATQGLPIGFYKDWVQVGIEEGRHFLYLSTRLQQLEMSYGDLPAHGGLWETAEKTNDNLLARLAVIPLVLEARGLDVTPKMIVDMAAHGDMTSSALLKTIYEDEISHVAVGKKWFDYLCDKEGLDPVTTYHDCVRTYFKGTLKRPFNEPARREAGLTPIFYEPLAE